MTKGTRTASSDTSRIWAAEHWIAIAGSDLGAKIHGISDTAARELGHRTGYLPVAEPLIMLAILIASPQPLFSHWLPVSMLCLILVLAAAMRIRLGQKISAAEDAQVSALANRYQMTVDVTGFSWGSLVGLMLLIRGIDQVTELALVASVGITATALTGLALELTLWRRFIFALWMPLLILTTATAIEGVEYAWLLLSIEVPFVVLATIQGQRIVREYIAGLLSRSEFECAAETISHQRDELLNHQNLLDELSAQAHNLSYYDQLTGIGSRNHFHERLESCILSGGIGGNRFGVLYLDVDGFKDINDTLGHTAGDELLKTVACRVRSLLGSNDFAARLGSDEIALLIGNIPPDHDAACMMQRCAEEIQLPVELNGTTITPRVSVGAALYPDDGDDACSLLKAAESAMNAAKRGAASRLRCARYNPGMTQAAHRRLTIEQELRLALSTDQFVLQYQPQIDANTGATCGVEALVRWQHPELGLVPPSDFIPVAESTCMIEELGEWVLNRACTQAVEWFRSGVPRFSVAVNISPLQLLDPGFVKVVSDTLQKTELPVELLELEITESAIQTHPEARETLLRLSELGVRMSIDDFGTGYSSLASLKSLPIDRVKIDRVFVKDMLASERDTALLGKIIDMAHVLGCDVVAEGVEERAHLDKLQCLNCDCLQGYYFSRPVDAREISIIARKMREAVTKGANLAKVVALIND